MAQYIRISVATAQMPDAEFYRLEYIGPQKRFSMKDRQELPAPDAEGVRFVEIPVQPGGYEVRYYADAKGKCVATDTVYLEGPDFEGTLKIKRTI